MKDTNEDALQEIATETQPINNDEVLFGWGEPDELDFPAWVEHDGAHLLTNDIEVGLSKKGVPQLTLVMKFMDGPNKGRTIRKWLTIQYMSDNQRKYLKRDLQAWMRDGIARFRGFNDLGEAIRDHEAGHSNEGTQALDELLDSAIGRITNCNARIPGGRQFPEIYPNTGKPSYPDVAAWTADPVASKVER